MKGHIKFTPFISDYWAITQFEKTFIINFVNKIWGICHKNHTIEKFFWIWSIQ
jgi:hypothetical protein